jgi:hypothetical protein
LIPARTAAPIADPADVPMINFASFDGVRKARSIPWSTPAWNTQP